MTLFINTCAFKKIIEVKLKLNIIFKNANSDIQQNNKEHYHKLRYCVKRQRRPLKYSFSHGFQRLVTKQLLVTVNNNLRCSF